MTFDDRQATWVPHGDACQPRGRRRRRPNKRWHDFKVTYDGLLARQSYTEHRLKYRRLSMKANTEAVQILSLVFGAVNKIIK